MKLRNLMWGACACILATGCSNDDVAVENGQSNIVQEGGQAYMNVRVTMGNGLGSRADEGGYAQGLPAEEAIKTIYFVFYDDEGNWIANGESVTVNEDEYDGNQSGNIDAIADAVVALKLPEGFPYPTQVVAYVNIPSAATLFGGKDLGDVNTNSGSTGESNENIGARATVLTSGNGATVASTENGFMMTNSTYLNEDNEEQIATSVSRENFFDTEEAAKEANPVDIYVERLAAKVSITNNATVQDVTTVGGYKLRFNAKGFALSGTNTKEYYLKNIQTDWSAWTWDWNERDDYRCFWAEDPNYSADEAATDLNHVSYDAAASMTSPQYCMENTMVGTVAGEFNTTTYLLLVGYYSVVDENDDPVVLTANGNDGNLYMYNGTAYLSTELIERLLNEIQQENPNLLAYVVNTGEDATEHPYAQAGANAYELVTTAENEVTTVKLQLKNEADTYYTTTNPSDADSYTLISDENYETFNTNLAEAVAGTINGYNEGKAYFAMPIEHFGGQESDPTGTYGIVRNHSYQLTITQVSGLGEGVFQPEKPIIPSDEQKTYYMAARLNVLSWKTVGNQNVEFK